MTEYAGPDRRVRERRKNGAFCPYYDPDEGHCREVTGLENEMKTNFVNMEKKVAGLGRWGFGVLLLLASIMLGAIQFYNGYQISRLDIQINRLLDKSDTLGINQSYLMANQKVLMKTFDIQMPMRMPKDFGR